MKRRDAFPLIAALPVAACILSAEEISTKDFDTVLVKVKGKFTRQAWTQMKDQLLQCWPDKLVIVVPEYMTLEFMKKGEKTIFQSWKT